MTATARFPMNCTPFTSAHLPALTNLLNTQLAALPPGWALTETQAATTLAQVASLWSAHFPEQSDAFDLEIWCVLADGRLLAAAQWGLPRDLAPPPEPRSAVLFWIVAEPGSQRAVEHLLATILARARLAACQQIALARFSFGVGWLGIPAAWTEVTVALTALGFPRCPSWVVLTGSTQLPAVPPPPALAGLELRWQVNQSAAEWELEAYAAGKLVAECEAWGIPPHFANCPGSAAWITLEWLGVDSHYQRQGLGRWLFVEQLRTHARRGITHAILWTEASNQAVLHLAQPLGFQVQAECWNFDPLALPAG